MASAPNSPSDQQPTSEAVRREYMTRRGVIALAALATLAALIAWWLWANTAVVPDVSGMTADDAEAALYEAGFVVGDVKTDKTALEDPGKVDDQGIPAGTRALKGEKVDIFIAEAPVPPVDIDVSEVATDTVDGSDFDDESTDSIRDRGDDETNVGLGVIDYPGVPTVLNQPEASAVSELRSAGYRVKIVRATNAGGIAKGRVFYQTPEPGAAVSGVTVEIWVSNGVPTGGHRLRPNIPWEQS